MTTTTWSVTIQATGDRTLTREEIVELADAVIPYEGIASGIGSMTYGVQILVESSTRDGAAERAKEILAEAAATAQLPTWPVSFLNVLSEQDELDEMLSHAQPDRRESP